MSSSSNYGKAPTFNNPESESGTLLKLVPDNIVNDLNLEPQYVRVRHGNNSYIYIQIDSVDQNSKSLLSTTNSGFLKVQRFAIQGFGYGDQTPNINIRNNVFQYILNGALYTSTIPQGFYTDIPTAMTALLTALNNPTPSLPTGADFTATQIPNSIYYTLSCNYSFYFYSGSGVINGKYLFGIPIGSVATASTSLVIGPILLYYTRWLDINSNTLTQYCKLFNASVFNSVNNIFRIYLDPPGLDTPRSRIFVGLSEPLRWINNNPSNSTQTIDFQILDEFGQPAYILNRQNLNLLILLLSES
jgi:hypothetical protein